MRAAGTAQDGLCLAYLIAYYALMMTLLLVISTLGVRRMRYISELSFYSLGATFKNSAVLVLLGLAGLPPLVLFMPKMALASQAVLGQPWLGGLATAGVILLS